MPRETTRIPRGLVRKLATQCTQLTPDEAGYLLASHPRRMRRAVLARMPPSARAPALACARKLISARTRVAEPRSLPR